MEPRILIVDDELRWREQFQDIIEGMGFGADAVEGIHDAKNSLQQRKYHLVLLDAALDKPNFALDCQQFCDFLHQHYPDLPVFATTGKRLDPDEVFELSRLGIVDFVFKSKIQLPDFRRRIQDAIRMPPSDSPGPDSITIENSASEKVTATGDDSVDVVIISALSKEQQAVLRHFGPMKQFSTKNRVYHKGIIPHENGPGAYSVVALSLPGMGNVQAAIATTQAITVWNPSQIILTGITGGIKTDTDRCLGDIIVGEQIVSYELGRVVPGRTERRFQVTRPAFPLIEAARNLLPEKWVLSAQIPRPDGSSGRVIPKIHFGVIASGEKVVADSTLTEELRSHWSKLVGIEMEGYGTALAAYEAETAPGMLMVKGICDWANSSKSDEWQEYAADIAAAFVIALLRTAPFTPRAHRPQAVKLTPIRYSGKSKIKLCRRLDDNWQDLADYFDVPVYHRRRFTPGRECQDLWDWLDLRNKLDGLKIGLEFIGRADLVEELSDND